MAAEGGVIITYIFTGEEERHRTTRRYIIPQNITHLIIHESVSVIPGYLFFDHPNMVEVYCHAGVKVIEKEAFWRCPRLRRVIIPGVEVVEACVFDNCVAVTDIECPKLESIRYRAFAFCKSWSNINLPSAKIVENNAFYKCGAMTEAKFGKHLESMGDKAFYYCRNIERITIPLKKGLFTDDSTFQCCDNLKHVDLVERAILQETADALLLEAWRNDMNEEIGSINQILPNAHAGTEFITGDDYEGEKAPAIREWITRVLGKIIDYKSQHFHHLDEIASALQLALPSDIMTNNVLPFLELPLHIFEGEEGEEEEEQEEDNRDPDNAPY